MPVSYPYTRYSGMWTAQSQMQAVGNGTWTGLPELWTWGANGQGQLGLGNRTNYSSPKQVGSPVWKTGAIGNGYTVVITTNGALWSWGDNNVGQLGLGVNTLYSSPKQVGLLTTWSSVSAGNFHTLGIKTDGTLWTWGANGQGQLGLGSTTYYSSPKQVGVLTTWSKVSCGSRFTLAIKTDGTLWSWGNNATYGMLGLSNRTNYSSPRQVGALTNWLNIAAGDYSSCAIKTDGTLWSWGYNAAYGQLGLGNLTPYSSPKQVGALTNWAAVTVAANHSLAVKTDGTLWSWGFNGAYGALGLNNITNYSSPKQVGALTTWSKVSAGSYFSFAIKTDGTLWGWGLNGQGQLGLGNITSYSSPKQVGSLTTWTAIIATTANANNVGAFKSSS